jgi:hypothetical protein
MSLGQAFVTRPDPLIQIFWPNLTHSHFLLWKCQKSLKMRPLIDPNWDPWVKILRQWPGPDPKLISTVYVLYVYVYVYCTVYPCIRVLIFKLLRYDYLMILWVYRTVPWGLDTCPHGLKYMTEPCSTGRADKSCGMAYCEKLQAKMAEDL